MNHMFQNLFNSHRKSILILLLVVSIFSFPYVQLNSQDANIPVSYTLADRDRAIESKAEMKSLNIKLDAMNDKFEAKFSLLQTLIYFVLSAILGFIGFVIWDRRATLKPFESKAEVIDEKYQKILNSLKELAKTNKEFETYLRINNLL